MKIYVVAWEGLDGGGFEWRTTKQDAVDVFNKLKADVGRHSELKIALLELDTDLEDAWEITTVVDEYLWLNTWDFISNHATELAGAK